MGKTEQRIIKCPGCGKTVAEMRIKENDHKKYYFQCKKCTTRFELVFNRPGREELERMFLDEDDRIPFTRVYQGIRSFFPFRLPRLRATGDERRPIFRKPIFKRKKR